MKKIVGLVLSITIIMSFFTSSFANSVYEDSQTDTVLNIPYNSGMIGISGQDGEGGEEDCGPESFYIKEDGTIYILDSLQSQILVFTSGKLINTFNLENFVSDGYMIDMVVSDNSIYILLSNNQIISIDNNGSLLDEFDLRCF